MITVGLSKAKQSENPEVINTLVSVCVYTFTHSYDDFSAPIMCQASYAIWYQTRAYPYAAYIVRETTKEL